MFQTVIIMVILLINLILIWHNRKKRAIFLTIFIPFAMLAFSMADMIARTATYDKSGLMDEPYQMIIMAVGGLFELFLVLVIKR